MNHPSHTERARLRRWTLAGALAGVVLLAAAVAILVHALSSRPLVDVRRKPLVIHGGAPFDAATREPVGWRQSIAPLDGPVDALRIRVADLEGLATEYIGDDLVRVRYATPGEPGAFGEWVTATNPRYTTEQGQEGHLSAELPTPVPAGVALEVELRAAHGALGARGTLSPFLRYRGPVRPLTPLPNRHLKGRTFVRECKADSNGLVPMTGIVVAIGEVDLSAGPLQVAVVRTRDGETLGRGAVETGVLARRGHLCVPLDRPVFLGRAEAMSVRIELPADGELLGDADGPSLQGLYGTPGPRPELRDLALCELSGATLLPEQDLALRLTGPPSTARGLAALRRGLGARHASAAVLFVLAAALVGRALAGATQRRRAPLRPLESTDARAFAARLSADSAAALAAARTQLAASPRPRRAWGTALLGALAVGALALALRVPDLDAGAMSPDDGEYLRSARIEAVTPGQDLGRAWSEDRAWVAELAEDFGRHPERRTYQHGYLHQLAIRWAYRLGAEHGVGLVTALRIDQALLGAATALLALLWLVRAVPREPWLGVLGGAFVAAQLVQAQTSRTGWGAAGCTFFLVAMIALAWWMRATPERARARLALQALGVAVCSVLAYGFHEMATVYVAALAVIAVLEFGRDDTGRRRRPWRSYRTWLGLAACVPVGALTLGLLFFSEYARATWFAGDLSGLGWAEARWLALRYFVETELPAQLGWPVLALAVVGFVGAVLRDVAHARWLALWIVLPSAVLFLRFNYPHLVRIYLPAFVLLCGFAAEGVLVLFALARTRLTRGLVGGGTLAALVWMTVVSWNTLHAPASAFGHVAGVHQAGRVLDEPRRPLTPILAALGAPDAAPRVGVRTDRIDPYYRLRDAGYPVEFFDPRWELARWPAWVLGSQKLMRDERRTTDVGGPYRLVAADRRGVLGLYVRE